MQLLWVGQRFIVRSVWLTITATYHDSVRMTSFMVAKLFPTAKTRWTDVDAVPHLARRVCTFYAYGMREVAGAAVAFDLQARLAHSYYVIKSKKRENPEEVREETGARWKETSGTHFGSPLAGTPSSDG